MVWKIILALVILVLPALLWSAVCRVIIANGTSDVKSADENLALIEPRRVFSATVSNREIINVWTVLMLTPTDGSTGFYLKTTNRALKEGDTVGIVEMEELTDLKELLRSAQIHADDEHGHFIFAEDHSRLAGKLSQKRREGETLIALGQAMQLRGLLLILPVCAVIAGVLIFSAIH
ncbi:MAG: hypothetical protein J6Z45_01130 [Oscillospiraceae bacterium]|nr:hypothetical protein [Oscillospiraceae bacterium]